jgi:hypothetical protein
VILSGCVVLRRRCDALDSEFGPACYDFVMEDVRDRLGWLRRDMACSTPRAEKGGNLGYCFSLVDLASRMGNLAIKLRRETRRHLCIFLVLCYGWIAQLKEGYRESCSWMLPGWASFSLSLASFHPSCVTHTSSQVLVCLSPWNLLPPLSTVCCCVTGTTVTLT